MPAYCACVVRRRSELLCFSHHLPSRSPLDLLQCVNKANGNQPFTPSDELIMVSLARSTGEIIRKAQAFQELREQRLISEVLLKLVS